MRTLRASLLFVSAMLYAAASPASAAQQDSFYLHPHDTVVFYGDSITDQRLYTMLTELFTVTRYPELHVKFVHSGWGGDRVTGGGGGPIDLRLQRDVLTYKPTVMTIMLGMNDGNYTNHKPTDDETYRRGYQHIVDSVRQAIPDLRITAIQPSPYDDVTRPINLQPDGYNAVLVNYSKWIAQYAPSAHLTVADFNAPVVAMLQKANAADHDLTEKILPDRVHPSLAGHMVMAEQLLKTWNARPTVAAVTIDAANNKTSETQFAKVTELHSDGGTVSWTELDDDLPLPFAQMLHEDHQGTLALVLRSSDVTESLNQEPLRITGLKAGKYKLRIDGAPIGAWSDAQLAQGVNLAILDTPMSKQAEEVRGLTMKRINIHQDRWRVLQVPLHDMNIPDLNGALTALDNIEEEVAQQQWAAAQPKPHTFQLTPE